MNTTMKQNAFWLCLTAVLCGCMATHADTLMFKSGDKLTGTVKSIVGGSMVFTSKVAGDITIQTADLASFTTDAANEVLLKNGNTVHGSIASAADGKLVCDGTTLDIAEIDKINPEKTAWHGSIGANATITRGNTRGESYSLMADANKRWEHDRIALTAAYYYDRSGTSKTDQKLSTDRLVATAQYDHFFSKKFYGYANAKYERDRIANLEMRLQGGLGVGYQWIDTSSDTFNQEAGLTYVSEHYSQTTDPNNQYAALRYAHHYTHNFAYVKGTSAFHNLEYLPDLEDWSRYLINADVGLRSALTARWAALAKIEWQYNSMPADNRYRSDLRYILGLTWTF